MEKEENVFNAVKDEIAELIKKAEKLPEDEKSKFVGNLSILNNVNEEMVKLYKNGLCRFSKHSSTIIYILLTNEKLLDKIVKAAFEVIRDSGDYLVVKKHNAVDTIRYN